MSYNVCECVFVVGLPHRQDMVNFKVDVGAALCNLHDGFVENGLCSTLDLDPLAVSEFSFAFCPTPPPKDFV